MKLVFRPFAPAALLSAFLITSVSAQVVVTTLDDEDDGSDSLSNLGDISLREAIEHSPDGTTITFDLALNGGVITLTEQLAIGASMTRAIDSVGLSNGITISGGDVTRVFRLSGELTLNGLTITNGNALPASGGGFSLLGEGSLNMTACTVRDCLGSNGGAFSNGGNAVLLENCTIVNNIATTNGGALSNGSNATFTMNQCTVTGNNSPGVEGLSIFNGEVNVTNSIIAGNGVNGVNVDGSLSTNSNNILSGDPQLSDLGDFGGPTQTMLPLSGSPAIDAGSTSDPGGSDQRGFPRFVNGAVDIGAVEIQAAGSAFDAFEDDFDFDGVLNGLELAIGTNPFVAEASDERFLRVVDIASDGTPEVSFGVADAEQANIILRLMRSTDLLTFDEVVSNENTDFQGLVGGVLTLDDPNPPTDGRAFYRLEVEPRLSE